MGSDSVDSYCLFNNSDLCNGNQTQNEGAQVKTSVIYNFCCRLLKFTEMSLKLTLLCGVLFGVFTTFFWWIPVSLEVYCSLTWANSPYTIRRFRVLKDSIQDMIVYFWPFLAIAPICSWSMIRKSTILFWCAIAGLLVIAGRFYLFIFHHYRPLWESYVGNVIFCVTAFIVFYKFARYRQQQTGNNESTIIVTLKLYVQLVFGTAIALPYNYLFLMFYYNSSNLYKTLVSCSIIAVLYIPKIIIANVITNLRGICRPDEGITFAAAFLVISTMVPRLTQAGLEGDLTYFTIISLFHGIFNVLDKLSLRLRRKISNFICQRSDDVMNESWIYVRQYIAHQSLISIITETSSIIWSNLRLYLMFHSYNEYFTLRDLCRKLGIAVFIELIFNVIALKLQNDLFDIPVLNVWQNERKTLIVIHLVQIVLIIA